MPQLDHCKTRRKSKEFDNSFFDDEEEVHTNSLVHSKWEVYCAALPPFAFLSLHDAQTLQCTRSHKAQACRFSVDGIAEEARRTHPNQQLFYSQFLFFLKELNLHLQHKKLDVSGFCIVSTRTLPNDKGDFELLKVLTQPYSVSHNGKILDFISWYIPLKPYEGEPFLSEIRTLRSGKDIGATYLNSIFQKQKKIIFKNWDLQTDRKK